MDIRKNLNSNNNAENELAKVLADYTVSLKDYIALIKVNWKPVLLIILSLLVLSTIYALSSPDIYRSVTMLKISRPKGNILDAAFAPDLRDSKTPFVQNEVEVLNSYTIREKVAKALIDSLRNDKFPEYYMIFNYDKESREWKILPEYKIVKELERKVTVEQKDELDIITISVESTSSYEAALVAKIYADVYHEMNMTFSRMHMINVRGYLEKQSREKHEKLVNAENTLRNYQEKDGIIALDEQSRALINQITDFESRKNAAKIELTIAERSLEDYKAELARQEPRIKDYIEKYAIEPYLQELQKGIAQFELKRDLALSNGNDNKNSELIKSYDARIADLKEKRDNKLEVFKAGMMASSSQEVKQLLQKVLEAEVRYHGLLASYNELNSIVSRYETKFNALPKKTIDIARLEREKGESEKLYLLLQEKYQEAIINEQSTPDNVLIVDPGRITYEPVKPNRPLIIILGCFVGFFLSIAYVTSKSYFDNKIHTPEEIQKLKLNLLGWIPKITNISNENKDFEFIVYKKPDSVPSEAYRAIRTRIQFARINHKPIKTILLTSSLPHEGKTLTSVNLAGSFAQAGKKTIIIDCDLRRPRIHKLLSCEKAPGLTDYLFGNLYYEEIIRTSEMNNLFVIPSGTKVSNPAEVLGSVKFYEFMKKIEEDFDIVILDSSPVLAVTDSEILSHLVDVSIIVVAAHSTETDVLKNAAELLNKDHNSTIGVLLNNFVYKNGYGNYYKSYTYYDDRPRKKERISNN